MKYQSKVFNTKCKIKRLIKLANINIYSAPCLAKIFNCDRKTIFRALKQNKITHVQFGIAGNKPFLQQIQHTLVKRCGVNRVKLYPLPPSGRVYKLQYTGTQIFKILDFLYKNSNSQTRLERKHNKVLYLKKKFKLN